MKQVKSLLQLLNNYKVQCSIWWQLRAFNPDVGGQGKLAGGPERGSRNEEESSGISQQRGRMNIDLQQREHGAAEELKRPHYGWSARLGGGWRWREGRSLQASVRRRETVVSQGAPGLGLHFRKFTLATPWRLD